MVFRKESVNLNPKKSLGQNFLVDDNISRKIINYFDIKQHDLILEIGPGYGSLSKHIISKTDKILAVELDSEISKYLTENFENINIINKNILEIDLSDIKKRYGQNLRIIGNIPYNITSQILFHIIDNRAVVQDALIMMQIDVAQRMIAKPRTKSYGILSVFSQCYSFPRLLFKISPKCFYPKPRVFSGMVHFDFKNKISNNIINDEIFRKVVRTTFGKRRKILSNSLKESGLELSKIDFDLNKRPEELSVEEFINLSNQVYQLKSDNSI